MLIITHTLTLTLTHARTHGAREVDGKREDGEVEGMYTICFTAITIALFLIQM